VLLCSSRQLRQIATIKRLTLTHFSSAFPK